MRMTKRSCHLLAKLIASFLCCLLGVVLSNKNSSCEALIMPNLPKLIAFDLDGTIWTPDMYELWGGGAPFKRDGVHLKDSKGVRVCLLGVSGEVLEMLKVDPKHSNVITAWVSCTDEPTWADECMTKFQTPGGHSLKSCVKESMIFKSNKKVHFQRLKSKYPEIDFSEMLFFDNEWGNIDSVSRLGVKCVYCPDGVTQQIWNDGLKLFN